MRVAVDTIKIGMWNMRLLRESGRIELLWKETETYKCKILAVQDMRWLGKGELHDFIWSRKEDAHH